jgi:hypothetical protein
MHPRFPLQTRQAECALDSAAFVRTLVPGIRFGTAFGSGIRQQRQPCID